MKEYLSNQEFKWVDTHCHLQLAKHEFNELDFSNIEYLIIPGVDSKSSIKAKEVTESLPIKGYWSAGLHPHDAKKLEEQKPILAELFLEADLIGETGLDYYRNLSSKDQQIDNLKFHLDASRDLKKPIIIHCRDSFEDVYKLVKEYEGDFPIILHSWTGGKKWTRRYLELDIYFSISGIVTYDTAKDLQLAVEDIPLEKLLLETDTPYLTPVPKRGEDNQPGFVSYTAKKVAEIKGVELRELSIHTKQNTDTVLGL